MSVQFAESFPAANDAVAPPPRRSREEILAGLPAIAAEIAAGAVQRELNRELPFEVFRRLRETGLTWLRVPRSLGGPGGTLADQVEITCTLAAADSNVAHALRGHFGFIESIALDPQAPASRKWVDEVLAGKLFGGANMEIGTPRPNMLRTTLLKDGDRYRLNGRKWYATGAIYADYTSFSALDEDGQMTGCLVPADRAGVRINDDWDGMGQRLTASGGVELDNVEVWPHEVSVRRSTNPFMRRHGAARAQLHLVAVIGGIVRNVLADATAYVQRSARSAKHSASETAAGDHFVQQAVGDIAAASHAIDTLIADAARNLDVSAAAITAGVLDHAALDALVMRSALAQSKTQIIVGRMAIQAAEQMFDTGGGSATARKYDFDRHWRNIRTILNHNPIKLRGRVIGDYVLNGARADFDEGRVF
ncbi:acyl-CoA dehydrogenase family protein [Paucibacter sp. R3-3]|uniref:Acyl-CoA dehydrogenase family protein n=1 Tax=Roseateles agri TaxID=3098619 RepID=A0ABU5DMZ1_9BURK|nr:acyl-CoA dehydrogenase family protein [Paucibacter sp. R3-3]MDY0747679.1 acyl-CoA dehydrogenase family protein [Paucibacter sp. R3-3]